MLVKFSSTATGSITMFGDVAKQLIRMLGASGNIPGAISAEDLPVAIRSLRSHLEQTEGDEVEGKDADEDARDVPIALATRATPLLEILQRAAANDAPVMWEVL